MRDVIVTAGRFLSPEYQLKYRQLAQITGTKCFARCKAPHVINSPIWFISRTCLAVDILQLSKNRNYFRMMFGKRFVRSRTSLIILRNIVKANRCDRNEERVSYGWDFDVRAIDLATATGCEYFIVKIVELKSYFTTYQFIW